MRQPKSRPSGGSRGLGSSAADEARERCILGRRVGRCPSLAPRAFFQGNVCPADKRVLKTSHALFSRALTGPGARPPGRVQAAPLVLINVSDHYTAKRSSPAEARRVMGCLLGFQRETARLRSAPPSRSSTRGHGIPTFDAEYLGQRRAIQAVFPKFDVVGWYTTGPPWTPTSTSRSTAPWWTERIPRVPLDPKADPAGPGSAAAPQSSPSPSSNPSSTSAPPAPPDGIRPMSTIETVEAERISATARPEFWGPLDPAGQYVRTF